MRRAVLHVVIGGIVLVLTAGVCAWYAWNTLKGESNGTENKDSDATENNWT